MYSNRYHAAKRQALRLNVFNPSAGNTDEVAALRADPKVNFWNMCGHLSLFFPEYLPLFYLTLPYLSLPQGVRLRRQAYGRHLLFSCKRQ